MLKPIRPQNSPETLISQAFFPLPFAPSLEFNSPAHGTWNIVHTGMQIPEAHQIYVCAANCMRGVVLTAAEMNASERFSMVILEEGDLLEGTVEDITIEGTADAIRKLPKRPPAVLLFTVCLHHFLGCDLDRIYRELREQFPNIVFFRCYMDPIMQKHGLTPDQKLRKAMLDAFPPCEASVHSISILGSDFALSERCELRSVLQENGYHAREIQDCSTFSHYFNLATSELFLSLYPAGKYGVEQGAKRLGRRFLYLPMCFGYEEIRQNWDKVSEELGICPLDHTSFQKKCDQALQTARDIIGTTPIAIDGTFHPRPLGLARLLMEHSFVVKTVYLDGISSEEERDFRWLQANAPTLTLKATIRPEMRRMPREQEEKVLALGQKAAWFENTPYFVNLVQGGGLWGYGGILELADWMKDAFFTEKDTRDIIPRKGLGCESCV